MIRRILYWLTVVAISAFLSYLIIRLAEGLDASQVGSAATITWSEAGLTAGSFADAER